ncbi:MAG TPA: hypothetical protein VJ779_12675 [Acetobacteraceae bacterium]|nr:hypothetical protein [Acetobacteraceae bacterium]
MAIDTGGWVYQGRQAHGWFGTGTKPKPDNDTPPERDPADAALFDPRNLGQRIDYAAYSAIGFADRQDRHHAAFNPDATARARLRNAMATWYGARRLSPNAFRERFLDPSASDKLVDRLRSAARLAAEARSHAELAQAGAALAGAMQRVGFGNWRRFVRGAEDRAIEAVSQGEVPGVVKTSGKSGDIVLSATFSPVPSSTVGGPKLSDQATDNHNLIPVNYFTSDPNHAARALGLPRIGVGNAIHKLKDAAGLRGDDDVLIHIPSGEVYYNGESIGNLHPA